MQSLSSRFFHNIINYDSVWLGHQTSISLLLYVMPITERGATTMDHKPEVAINFK